MEDPGTTVHFVVPADTPSELYAWMIAILINFWRIIFSTVTPIGKDYRLCYLQAFCDCSTRAIIFIIPGDNCIYHIKMSDDQCGIILLHGYADIGGFLSSVQRT